MFLFYDIETSGFERDSDVYEFGFVRTDDCLNVISSGNLYFYQKEWGIKASHVHGLTRQFLEQHEQYFAKNLATLYALCHNTTWVGKNNISYDNIVLSNFMSRYEPKGVQSLWPAGTVDVQKMCGRRWREWHQKKFGENMGRKSGTLPDYIAMTGFSKEDIDGYMKANRIVMPEGRDKLHSALYDTVLTLCAAKYCIFKFGDMLR